MSTYHRYILGQLMVPEEDLPEILAVLESGMAVERNISLSKEVEERLVDWCLRMADMLKKKREKDAKRPQDSQN